GGIVPVRHRARRTGRNAWRRGDAEPPSFVRTLLARAGGSVRHAGAVSPLQARGGRGTAVKPVNKWAVLAVIAGGILVADQVTKYLAVAHLTYAFQAAGAHSFAQKLDAFVSQRDLLGRGGVQVIPNFWQFRYTQNPGAAWG